jgi:hypothetical protein
VPYYRLYFLIRVGLIDEPPRSDSGDFLWFAEHVEAARGPGDRPPAP